jgi:restriction endonuclease Mrr
MVMPKFRVVIREITEYTYDLPAKNVEEAEDTAMDVFAFDNEKLHSAERISVDEMKPECVLVERLSGS